MIEWVPLSQGGKVTSVDPATLTFVTEFGSHKAAVANVIPPQQAGAHRARRPASPTAPAGARSIRSTFESTLRPGIHVHRRRGHHGRHAEVGLRRQRPGQGLRRRHRRRCWPAASPVDPKLINTCYSLVAPDYGISVAGVYRPDKACSPTLPGAGGVSPLDAPWAACAARRRSMRELVPHHHRRDLRLMPCGACVAARSRARRRSPRPRSRSCAADRGRCHSRLAHRPAGRCGARPGDRRRPQRRPLPALPLRPVPRGALPGRPRAQPRRRGLALVGGAVAAADRRRRASQCRHDHAVLLPDRRACSGSPATSRARPILSAAQIEDVVAYLVTLKD